MINNDVSLSIVLPLFNEGANLAMALEQVTRCASELAIDYELVLVDDGSTDNTWAAIENAAEEDAHVRGISLSRNFGKEAAMLAGMEASRGRAVVVMDGDLQHPPEVLSQMYRLWNDEGYDIVNGVKVARQDESLVRRVAARVFYYAFERLTRSSLANNSDFKLLDRRVVTVYCNLPERNRFFRGLVSWLGYRQTSVPFSVPGRQGGGSKWSLINLCRLAIDAVTSFSTIPLHFVTLTGALFLILAGLVGLHTVIMTLSGRAEEGFPTVILLILIVGSILMISLGIIGEYLAKIYEEIKSRPAYLVRHRIGASAAGPGRPLENYRNLPEQTPVASVRRPR